MMRDRIRMNAYHAALQETVKPGSVVVDIGTGAGVCAFLACQLGAKRVYAIEPDPIITLARLIAQENDYCDRITFLQDLSTRIKLPEKADVIVSDLRGILPLFEAHIPSIIDARGRFLAPEGVLIPQQDKIWVQLGHLPTFYHNLLAPWQEMPFQVSMNSAKKFKINRWYKCKIKPEQGIGKPQLLATLDYTTITSPHLQNTLTWTNQSHTTLHGLVLWFDTKLTPNNTTHFSNSPHDPTLIYGNAFFPLEDPVELQPDDQITVTLKANLVKNDYIWQWNTEIKRDNQLIHSFKQSTFKSQLLSKQQLKSFETQFQPQINLEGKVTYKILELMQQNYNVKTIAEHLYQQFPEQFPTWKIAFKKVIDVIQNYCVDG